MSQNSYFKTAGTLLGKNKTKHNKNQISKNPHIWVANNKIYRD